MTTKQTYRFKFSDELSTKLMQFTKLHQLETPHDFKISWIDWIEKNERCIEKEYEMLSLKGYNGNIKDKMYISVRYYHKMKLNDEKKTTKKRKSYVGFDRSILDIIDVDIKKNQLIKPSIGYNNFRQKKEFEKDIVNEKKRLFKNNNISEEEFEKKLKKTYKNRYFIKQKE